MIDSKNVSDAIGAKTLDVISKADNFNKWMYQTIKPFCKGNILEIGSGIGNISKYFFKDGFSILLTDFRQEYCDFLKEKYGDNPNCLGIGTIDLVHPEFEKIYNLHLNSFDTVFALNVIEHIDDDVKAIENAKKMLKPNGHLVILVPAYQTLYNKFDEGLGHYRRYTKKSLKLLFRKAYMPVLNSQYFNLVGTLGWWVSGSVFKKQFIPAGQMKLYNKLVRLIKLIDKVAFRSIGLSVIVVGKKTY